MSTFDITTLPVPDGVRNMSALEVVTCITLSFKLIDESIVKSEIFTTPDPPGWKIISAFDVDAIMLSLNVRLSMDIVPTNELFPVVVVNEEAVSVVTPVSVPVVAILSSPKLIAPLESVIDPFATVNVLFNVIDVDVVTRFSLPKLIAPDESVIDPFAKVKFPIVEPVALVIVPVVVTFSSLKLIAPDESVIDPFATVSVLFIGIDVDVVARFSLPKSIDPPESVIDPSASVKFPKVELVATVSVPVVDKFSLPKLIAPDESVIVPSAKVRLPSVEPVSAEKVPVVVRFSFPKLKAPDESVIDPFARVRLPSVDPVPPEMAPEREEAPVTNNVPSTISPSLILIMLESDELIVAPENPTDPITTLPEPLAEITRSSFDLVPVILLPIKDIAGKTMCPVPLASSVMSALESDEDIKLPDILMCDSTEGLAKSSRKLSFILLPDSYSESPDPSLPCTPTSTTDCVILAIFSVL
jgi:hypothetical protein